MNRPHLNRSLKVLASVAILSFLAGCSAFGVIASKFPQNTPPSYKGLAGHTVGVMVWADRSVQIDWNSVQVDLAGAVQQYLKVSDAEEVKGVTYPVRPSSIVRYQLDHPGTELTDITETAPKLGVQRLIYIELGSLTTRAASSVELFRGSATANLRVVEIEGDHARVAYEEHDIKVVFPKHTTSDGTVNGDDTKMYRGVINMLATEIGDRVITHPSEHDESDPMTTR